MKARNVFITYNNPKEDIHLFLDRLKGLGFTYARCLLERGELGTLHILGMAGGK